MGGKPLRILAGNFHYFRSPQENWGQNLDRMLALGLNAVEFYIPWNYHETYKNTYDFSSNGKNVTHFLQLLKEKRMYALVRPGPYICAEWEFGGFPAWFLSNGTIQLRTYAEPYITYVKEWYDVLLPRIIKPFLMVGGGSEFNPIVMVQVENEYGSYGNVANNRNDAKYLQFLIDLSKSHLGEDVILYTTDGGNLDDLRKGTFNDSQVVSFGDGCKNATSTWNAQKQFNPPNMSPFMCTEFYTGWLTHWGENYSATATQDVVTSLEQVLEAGENGYGSVSLYMAHGGTNFGYWSGANGNGGSGGKQAYRSVTTSYDYNAPIAIGGKHGIGAEGKDKYLAIQNVLLKYTTNGSLPPEPPKTTITKYEPVNLTRSAGLMENIAAVSTNVNHLKNLVPMEEIGCLYGYIVYSTNFSVDNIQQDDLDNDIILSLPEVQDRALVFIDGSYVGQISRQNANLANVSIALQLIKSTTKIDVLVGNEGRIGFTTAMVYEQKGIIGNTILLNNGSIPIHIADLWTMRCLPLLNSTKFSSNVVWKTDPDYEDEGISPRLYQGTLSIRKEVYGTFINMSAWNKGQVWINGQLLGRYWSSNGPQETLYLPAAYLNVGENTIVILELFDQKACCNDHTLAFSETPSYKIVNNTF